MRYSRLYGQMRIMAIFLAATLAACGQGPESSDEALALGGANYDVAPTTLAKLLTEEEALRNDPNCQDAPSRYLSTIADVIERFNDGVVAWHNAPYLAYHPGRADGISVLFCTDGRITAYAYAKTVAVHDGLLTALDEGASRFATKGSSKEHDALFSSALAFVLYHELAHAEMGHTHMIGKEKSSRSFLVSLLEFEADAYAAAALHAAGYSMEGAEIVFDLLGKTNPSGSIYHPTSDERAIYLSRYGE